MLKTLSPSSPAPTPPPKLALELGLDWVNGSGGKYRSKIPGIVKDVPGGGKPRTLLCRKCSELAPSTFLVLQPVQLLLTSSMEILVRLGDISCDQTLLRRHNISTGQIREHPHHCNALLVEEFNSDSSELKQFIYQMDKEKYLKEWLYMAEAFKRGAGQGEQVKISSMKSTVKQLDSSMSERERQPAPSVSTYVQGPGSPALHNRSTCVLPPSKILNNRTKGKLKLFERIANVGGVDRGLFRRNIESLNNKPTDKFANHLTSMTTNDCGLEAAPISNTDAVLNKPECNGDVPNSSFREMSLVAPSYSSCDAIEEDGEEEVEWKTAVSDSSDVASDSCSGFSSRCSSMQLDERQVLADSFNNLNISSPITDLRHIHVCTSVHEDVSDKVSTTKKNKHLYPKNFLRRANGLLQMSSLKERRKKRENGTIYVRDCRSTSDIDHLTYDNQVAHHLTPSSHHTSMSRTAHSLPRTATIPHIPTSPPGQLSPSPSGALSPTRLGAPSPSPSQNSESDNGDNFLVSKFHHTQIRKDKWRRSPRISSPMNQSPMNQSPMNQSPMNQSPMSQSPLNMSPHLGKHPNNQRDGNANASIIFRHSRGRSLSVMRTCDSQCSLDQLR